RLHTFLSLQQKCSSSRSPPLHSVFPQELQARVPGKGSLCRVPSLYHIHIYLLRIVPLLSRKHLHQPLPLLFSYLRRARLQNLQPTLWLPLPCLRFCPFPHGCPDNSIFHTLPVLSAQSLSAYPDFH